VLGKGDRAGARMVLKQYTDISQEVTLTTITEEYQRIMEMILREDNCVAVTQAARAVVGVRQLIDPLVA
jgi:hypothetical protein